MASRNSSTNITSRPGGGNKTYHYSNGKHVGTSYKSGSRTTHYDAGGKRVGTSYSGAFTTDHYDAKGHRVGTTYNGSHRSTHYDASGRQVGSTHKGSGGSSYTSSGDGCYIATCVYGSYDCPEVWTLRRFRDEYLAGSGAGRSFIRCYYAVSPWLVKHLGGWSAVRKVWKAMTDFMVRKLAQRGVENTPYPGP